MLISTRATAIFLCAALSVGNTCAMPSIRAPITDPCVSTIPRTPSTYTAVATACFQEISDHVFGNNDKSVTTGSGMHLASKYLARFPGALSSVNQQTLIVMPDTTDSTKTLWMDDGLYHMATTALAAKKTLDDAQTALQTAKNAVATQQAFNDKSTKPVKDALVKKLKTLQQTEKTKQTAVDNANKAITPKDQVILKLNQSVDIAKHKAQLYTQPAIQNMCIDAMKQSLAANGGKLVGDVEKKVAAPNLGSGGSITVRLLKGTDAKNRARINSCFPLLH